MGEGGEGRHRGHGLHAGPWPLLSVGGIVAVSGSMVPGGRIRSSCWRNVPSFDDVGVMGEGGARRYYGHHSSSVKRSNWLGRLKGSEGLLSKNCSSGDFSSFSDTANFLRS